MFFIIIRFVYAKMRSNIDNIKGKIMKKVLLILVFLSASLCAKDFLAELTDGRLSDNSPGVKVLTLEEKKQIKGGYVDFIRVPEYDHPFPKSYAYQMYDTDKKKNILKEFGLSDEYILLAKVRFINGKKQYYFQSLHTKTGILSEYWPYYNQYTKDAYNDFIKRF